MSPSPPLPPSQLARNLYRQAPVSAATVVLIVLVFVVTAVQSRSITGNLDDSGLGDVWILYLPLMDDSAFGPLRALGSGLLHAGIGHMLINVVLLFLIGRETEATFGSPLTAGILVTGAVGASATVLWWSPEYPTVGASGAVYALMAVFVAIAYSRKNSQVGGALVLIGVNLAYTLMTPGVSLWGHLGGLATGALLAAALFGTRRTTARWLGLGAVCAVAVAAVLIRVAEFSTGDPGALLL
ncbi:rhomboid family intramembrane serine protease [Corynebacterium antarcticum]|uniref:Rhomboid family intramembrane serine protease n=1 Tax=Corynebacterium antarcticum TaxID=2800405 RepID=A0A9Q4CBR1_9CORY|nr:rhomboid family intramembrane serine protease [Corynebacterium antarcticum]MCK7642645.1 rhomboid family intramembrane serine protease [Corynebacterium antarcticum]MCK7660667.1 rhomboid family intramembrane serine protease [Corynebacterium antarcticum]MCX7537811.1 rhomboid family intramembrane serine protease [Corynebacterium antarcticum]MCX7539983.1 rhomboid family intramembrane serine protease [Corynebacterium antarcticum]